MAEAVGLASSIVALVQLSATVYIKTSKFYKDAKDAKSKIRTLATQAQNLSGLLQSLSLLASSPMFDDVGASVPLFRDTYIESCHATLTRIKRKIEKAESDFGSGSHKRSVTRSLKWPFENQETQDLMTELSRHQEVLKLALSAETMEKLLQCLANMNSIADSVDGVHQKLDRKASIDTRAELTTRREEVARFFSKFNPESHLQDSRSRRQPNTGKWLIERDQTFRKWIDCPDSGQIWLSGIPGAGKTILCGTVIDEILQKQSPSTAVAFFFCDYKYPESQKPVNILAALAVQLAKQDDDAFDLLESCHEEVHPHNRMGREPDTREMTQVLRAMTAEYDHVYLAIDGLDECDSNVAEVVRSLNQLAEGLQVSMALFSRKEPEIAEAFANSDHVEIAAHTEDIELYVLAEMENRKRLRNLAVKNPDLHEHIRRSLIEGANGMFRWVACQLDHLDSLSNDARRRKALTELPPTLFETYDRILDRIMLEDECDQQICRKALHWIGLGYESLDISALCEAISIPDDQDTIGKDHLVEPEWLSDKCSSLIRLAHGDHRFEFAHFTVKEYLRSIKPQSGRNMFRFSDNEAIRHLLASSLRFLTFSIFNRKPTNVDSAVLAIKRRNEQHPFYPFAANYIFCCPIMTWEQNINNQLISVLKQDVMMQYASDLFDRNKSGIFLSWVLQFVWSEVNSSRHLGPLDDFNRFIDIDGLLYVSQLSPLHIAAMLKLPPVCAHLLDNYEVNVNERCSFGTPLHAILGGLRLLSDPQNIIEDPFDSRNNYKYYGNKDSGQDQAQRCLEILLERGADTSLRWNTTSVLRMAMNYAWSSVPNLWIAPLLNQSTMVDDLCIQYFKDKMSYRKLPQATLNAILRLGSIDNLSPGWTRLVSLSRVHLLDWEAAPCEAQGTFRTSISDEDFADAVEKAITHSLIDNLGAFVQDPRFRPDMTIQDDLTSTTSTLLHFALSEQSHSSKRCDFGIVELLLGAGCDIHVVGASGETLLHDCNYLTTRSDTAEITTLLIELGINDLVKDDDGNTCWHHAVASNNISFLEVLLDMSKNNQQALATTSSRGKTPIACAIHGGNLESARLLLDHCSTNIASFQSDESLLNGAARIGSEDLFVRLYKKLKELGATEAIESSKPLDHITLSCGPGLLDYLLGLFPVSKSESNAKALTSFSLHMKDYTSIIAMPQGFPAADRTLCANMDHIIGRLLPPEHVFIDDEGTRKHFWEIFCDVVVPYFTNGCGHRAYYFEQKCWAHLIGPLFERLIAREVLTSYERQTRCEGYKILFRAILSRGDLRCAWIVPTISKVIEANVVSRGLSSEPVCIELLARAIREDLYDLTRVLLKHGIDVLSGHGSLSPLELACSTSTLSMFQLVLLHSNKSLISKIGSQGKTLLHWAVSARTTGNPSEEIEEASLEKIKQLLQLDASIDAIADDPTGDSALTLASRTGCLDIVELLVARGANPLHRARDGWTILHTAALNGDARYIIGMVPTETPNSFWLGVCCFSFTGFAKPLIMENTTALHLIARSGRSHFLEYLIREHIPFDVNAVTGYPMFTPLHLAAYFGHLEVVKLLMLSKASVNARDANGNLAVELAGQNSHLSIVRTLLESGSEKPSRRVMAMFARLVMKEPERSVLDHAEGGDKSRIMLEISFEIAVSNGNLHLCKELMDQGLSINTELPCDSCTPLVRAVVEGQTGIIDWLISVGPDVTIPVGEGFHPSLRCISALSTHYITSAHTLETVLSLALKQNMSWYNSKLSPLHVAILDNNIEALGVILSHIRENDHLYREMIETELMTLPTNTSWKSRSTLSIMANVFNHQVAFRGSPLWVRARQYPSMSPLHIAILENNLAAVRLLLKHEADVSQADSLGRTPLGLAASSRHSAQLVTELLKAEASLANSSRSTHIAMRLAVRNCNLEVVKILAEADPETLRASMCPPGSNLLSDASTVEVFSYLMSCGLELFEVNRFGYTELMRRLFNHSSTNMSGFIINSGLIPNIAEESINPVAIAAANEDPKLLRKLYRTLPTDLFAVLVNRSDNCGEDSALCWAAFNNDINVTSALIDMGADIGIDGCPHGSPLMAACYLGNLDVVKYLVRSGSALAYVNEHGLHRNTFNLSDRHANVKRWLLVDRHVEQRRLEHQSTPTKPCQSVWSGRRLFRLVLPTDMSRSFGESSWDHLQRLQKMRRDLLGATLAERRKNCGLDFGAEDGDEARKSEARAAHRQFLSSLGEKPC